jgi:hypothetical protein
MNKFSDLINSMEFHTITKKYTSKKLAENLSFDEARILAYKMFLNKEFNDELREYAVELLDQLRCIYVKEWSADWRNDVFLGDASLLIRKYDEQYAAYKRAYEKIQPPHPYVSSIHLCDRTCQLCQALWLKYSSCSCALHCKTTSKIF